MKKKVRGYFIIYAVRYELLSFPTLFSSDQHVSFNSKLPSINIDEFEELNVIVRAHLRKLQQHLFFDVVLVHSIHYQDTHTILPYHFINVS